VFFLNFEPTGAASGLGGIPTYTTLPVVWVVALLALFLCFQIDGSRIGRAIEAVREDELAAEGVASISRGSRSSIFGLGPRRRPLAASLFAHYATFIDPGHLVSRSRKSHDGGARWHLGNFIGATAGAIGRHGPAELLRIATRSNGA